MIFNKVESGQQMISKKEILDSMIANPLLLKEMSKIPKKIKLKHLDNFKVLECMAVIMMENDASGLTFEETGERQDITPHGWIGLYFYQEGISLGLKSQKLLDYINKNSKDVCKSYKKLYDSIPKPHNSID
jgi:hypothetical protein